MIIQNANDNKLAVAMLTRFVTGSEVVFAGNVPDVIELTIEPAMNCS